MGTRLYVGNLPFSADEDQIRDRCSPKTNRNGHRGEVDHRPRHRPASRGFGFVEMGSNGRSRGGGSTS